MSYWTKKAKEARAKLIEWQENHPDVVEDDEELGILYDLVSDLEEAMDNLSEDEKWGLAMAYRRTA